VTEPRKHVMNGDERNGWYCYECRFSTRDVALAAAHDGVRISTDYSFPPIPIRQFDWCAYDDNTYDGPGSILGHGRTEQEAIDDLTQQLSEAAPRTAHVEEKHTK
jgi:hypothetical protein